MTNSVLSLEDKKAVYDEIIHLYHLAQHITDSTGLDLKNGLQAPEKVRLQRLEIALPVVKQVEISTNIIQDIYMLTLEENRTATPIEIRAVEKALRSIFNTILHYTETLETTSSF